ncbi:hypothetical protein B0537_09400 [Desulforamulus ferrireducens]|uniref:DUF2029 domain-containing protein n=1 Tax=Desulforamulus ferrireducens TaxID=1833852 RepID=A0A1S6IWZ1_9FIRM|nr:hypothetical protein B0537_09400 [Desulforamulus ferrireducens]
MKQRLFLPGSLTLVSWLVLLLASWPNSTYTPQGIFPPLILALVFVTTFFLYMKTISADAKAARNHEVIVWTMVLTLTLVILFPFACQDVYYYIATGHLAERYQANPYLTTAHQIKDWRLDPFLSATNWGFLTSVYGPLWTKVSQWLVALTNQQFWCAVYIFKLFAGIIHLVNTLIIGLTARRLGCNPTQAMFIYGWNPLLLFELPGHAHNDALLITFIILSVYALTVLRGLFCLPFLTLAVLVKYTPVLLVPFFFGWLIKKRWLTSLLLGGLLALALVVLWWLPYWEGITTLQGVLRQQNFYSIKSLHYILYLTAQDLWPTADKALIFKILSAALSFLFVMFYLWLLAGFWRRQSSQPWQALLSSAVLVFVLYLLLANKWFQPWYLSWLLALAPLLPWPNPLLSVTLFLSLTAELSRLPQMLLGHSQVVMHILTFLVAWCPLLLYFVLQKSDFPGRSDDNRQ